MVLPVMVANDEQIFSRYPLLRDKRYLRWDAGVPRLVSALAELLGREFRSRWSFAHPAAYSGPVWIQILPEAANLSLTHRYTVRWRPWEYSGTLTFANPDAVCLSHMKGGDQLSIPLFLDVSPACFVTFGQGTPPSSRVIDINFGWRRVEPPDTDSTEAGGG